MLIHPYLSVGLKRNRQPNERRAISKLNHTRDMNESENTFADRKPAVKHGPNFIDRIGQKIGSLTIISLSRKNKHGHSFWECRCDCGNTKVISWANLSRGTKSCGCSTALLIAKSRTTHGRSETSEYAIWRSMKARCYNPKHIAFFNYGGRGIRVCARWLNSFENFLADMGERPKGFSINRKDNDGNYEPLNCEWASMKQQQNNRRGNRRLQFNGKNQTVGEWAKELGIKHSTISKRIARGLTVEKCLTKS